MSVAIFYAHIYRWTRNHRWFALREWAARNRYSLYSERKASVPIPLASLMIPPPIASIALAGPRCVLLEMQSAAPASQSVGETAVGQTAAAETTADETAAGEMTAGQTAMRGVL